MVGAIASALVDSIMGYNAWHIVTFVVGEITNPKRNIGSAVGNSDGDNDLHFAESDVTEVLPMDHNAVT
jgi:hypothetical protein